MKFRNLALPAVGVLFCALASFAQTSSIEGDVKGEDGQPLKGALVKIDRLDIKGNYKVKTDKKGHYFHAGLPLGMYKVSVEVDGKDMDSVNNIKTRLGDPLPVNFDLQSIKKRSDAAGSAADAGQLSKDQERTMTAAQKAEYEKALKERETSMKKNKALNDAFNEGVAGLQAKNFDAASAAFAKAAEMDPKQHVVFAQLAEAYVGQSAAKTDAAERDALMQKGLDAYGKAIELKPDDAAYHNNYALALVKAKKIPEAQSELTKAAQLDPTHAGQYYYNLGAVLTNSSQAEAAGQAFQEAVKADPTYAEAYYQIGVNLIGRAQMTPDGKMIPPAGTQEAFEKYLGLKPDGPNADAAKAMLQSIGAQLQTSYKNASAPAPASKKATTPTKKK